jgi:hypothetical protein
VAVILSALRGSCLLRELIDRGISQSAAVRTPTDMCQPGYLMGFMGDAIEVHAVDFEVVLVPEPAMQQCKVAVEPWDRRDHEYYHDYSDQQAEDY